MKHTHLRFHGENNYIAVVNYLYMETVKISGFKMAAKKENSCSKMKSTLLKLSLSRFNYCQRNKNFYAEEQSNINDGEKKRLARSRDIGRKAKEKFKIISNGACEQIIRYCYNKMNHERCSWLNKTGVPVQTFSKGNISKQVSHVITHEQSYKIYRKGKINKKIEREIMIEIFYTSSPLISLKLYFIFHRLVLLFHHFN